MAQFEGSNRKVRCADCTKLFGTHCSAKNVKVSPKKRRLCNLYEFKGEFTNRTTAQSMYVPHVDSKTRRELRKLLNMGKIPLSGVDSSETEAFTRTKILDMPASTATVGVVKNSGEDLMLQKGVGINSNGPEDNRPG